MLGDGLKKKFAVRETSASRHNGGPIKDPPLIPRYDSAVMVEGVSMVSLMSRDACLSDSYSSFLSVGDGRRTGVLSNRLRQFTTY